jgi:predicted amino acid racemase
MSAPRLEVDLEKIHHNARTLNERLSKRRIAVTGITKATLGSPEIARTLLRAGIGGLGESRIENIECLQRARVAKRFTLIRSPMISQVERVVENVRTSLNSEIEVIRALSAAATKARRTHEVVLMVELGDLREGILPGDLEEVVRQTLECSNIKLIGIGTNLACRSGVAPDSAKMKELSRLANRVESTFDLKLSIVSGGNSSALDWALQTEDIGRINNLRLGESILLGREPLERNPIDGLHTDAFTLFGEVIESGVKPSQPWGTLAQSAYGRPTAVVDRGDVVQTILAVGHQDTDPDGLRAADSVEVLSGSSDHLIVTSDKVIPVGSEIAFQPNYAALARAMNSPFVAKVAKVRTGTMPLS